MSQPSGSGHVERMLRFQVELDAGEVLRTVVQTRRVPRAEIDSVQDVAEVVEDTHLKARVYVPMV